VFRVFRSTATVVSTDRWYADRFGPNSIASPRVGSYIGRSPSSHAATCCSAAAHSAGGASGRQLRPSGSRLELFFAGDEACREAGGRDLTNKSNAASAPIPSGAALIFLCVPALAYSLLPRSSGSATTHYAITSPNPDRAFAAANFRSLARSASVLDRTLLTAIGQAEQYMFCTVSVTVLSPAKAGDKPKAEPEKAAVSDFAIAAVCLTARAKAMRRHDALPRR